MTAAEARELARKTQAQSFNVRSALKIIERLATDGKTAAAIAYSDLNDADISVLKTMGYKTEPYTDTAIKITW